jgi:hypothetical protein
VRGFRRLAAVVAVFAAVALTAIAPAGAHDSHPPRIEHCHYWPGLTEVHWDKWWLLDNYGSSLVTGFEFDWVGAWGPTLYTAWKGEANAEAATPIGSTEASAVLTLANGNTVQTTPKNCS